MEILAQFQTRICCSLAFGDPLIPSASGMIHGDMLLESHRNSVTEVVTARFLLLVLPSSNLRFSLLVKLKENRINLECHHLLRMGDISGWRLSLPAL